MISAAATGKKVAESFERFTTSRERSIGLLKYSSTPTSYGAIFELPFGGVFPLIHTFGMKFPIDIFFCDSEKRILWLKRNVGAQSLVMPWKYFLGGCRYLVEFSKADTADLSLDQKLEWPDR